MLAGHRYVVLGWPRAGAGRRSLPAGAALLDTDGEIVAQGEAVWVSVDVPMHDMDVQGTAVTS